MTDRELLELIAAQVGALTKDVSELKEGQDNIKYELKEFRAETNTRFDSLDDKLSNLEGTNAANHISINGELKRIKSSLSKVEIITADNWEDIARLKAKTKHKI